VIELSVILSIDEVIDYCCVIEHDLTGPLCMEFQRRSLQYTANQPVHALPITQAGSVFPFRQKPGLNPFCIGHMAYTVSSLRHLETTSTFHSSLSFILLAKTFNRKTQAHARSGSCKMVAQDGFLNLRVACSSWVSV
jgi:hypothetical protein